MTSERKQQFTRRITEANPTELSVILYEMTVCYLGEAEEALRAGDDEALRHAASRAKGCLAELMQGLHLEYEPAPSLRDLYRYGIRRVTVGELRREPDGFAEVRRMVEALRAEYAKIADQNPDGPVMENSQAVYAGLTYGRSDVNESLVGDVNRGFRV